MRIRTIKPEFWTDPVMVRLPAIARLVYIALWNYADDYGCFLWEPDRIELALFPAEFAHTRESSRVLASPPATTETLACVLAKLVEVGRIRLYEVTESALNQTRIEGVLAEVGDVIAHIPGFNKHQRVDRKSKRRLPEPSVCRALSDTTSSMNVYTREDSRVLASPRDGREKEVEREVTTSVESNDSTDRGVSSETQKAKPRKLTDSPGDCAARLRESSPEIREGWSAFVQATGRSERYRFTKSRSRKLREQLEAHGLEAFKRGLEKLSQSAHHRGENQQGKRYDGFESKPLCSPDAFESWTEAPARAPEPSRWVAPDVDPLWPNDPPPRFTFAERVAEAKAERERNGKVPWRGQGA